MVGLRGAFGLVADGFAVHGFERASQDRFFLCIRSIDPLFDGQGTRAFLEALSPEIVREVPA